MTVYRVVEPFATDINGVPRVYRAGDLVRSGDPAHKGREVFFVEAEEYASRSAVVEQATADPGELREVSKPRRGRKPRVKDEPTEEPKDDVTEPSDESVKD